MTKLTLLFLLLVGHVTSLPDQATQDAAIIARIDEFVNGVMSCYGVPGLTLAAVRNGVPFLAKGYGVKDLDTQEPVTNQTLFVVASITKQFVGTVVGQALEKHNLTYDTPVRTILGDWFYMKDPYLTAKLNLKDALAHRSGLPGHNMLRRYMFQKRDLYERFRHLDATAPPRTRYKYNNIMYGLASYVAETLEGRDWEDLARDQIFNPLGMTSTTFAHQANDRLSEIATSYGYDGPDLREIAFETISTYYAAISAPGGLTSNSADMTKWLAAQVNGGYNEANVSVISDAVLSETRDPAMSTGGNPLYMKPREPVTLATGDSYGLGFSKGYYRGYSLIGHGGVIGGFRSQLYALPDMGVGVFVNINGPMAYVNAPINTFVMDLMLGEEPWLTVDNVCNPLYTLIHTGDDEEDELLSAPITGDEVRNDYPVEKLIGSFYNHAYAELRISYDVPQDILRLEYGPHISFTLSQAVPGSPWYSGQGDDPFWTSSVSRVDFADCDGAVCERVEVTFDWERPPTFYRTLSPAPPPEPPCPSS